jgi:membrane protease YdiL (CAAX protease family)
VRARRLWLSLEFLGLFGVLPWLYRLGWIPLPVLPALWLVATGCLLVLLASPGFDRRRLWRGDGPGGGVWPALKPVLLAAPLLVALAALVEPTEMLRMPTERPLLWATVLLLYPVLSVYPQGVVYRAFLFHRYRELLPGRWSPILASAVGFSFVHVVFDNWLAPTLTLGGGVLFAWTYDRTRSLLLSAIQHALCGCLLFTLGLGRYFYKGLIGLS